MRLWNTEEEREQVWKKAWKASLTHVVASQGQMWHKQLNPCEKHHRRFLTTQQLNSDQFLSSNGFQLRGD